MSDEDRSRSGLERYPAFLVRRLNQVSTAHFSQVMAENGLDVTPVQFAALREIADAPGLDQGTLASRIACDRVTTGDVINRLVRKKLVERHRSTVDRRSRALFVSEDGRDLLASIMPLIDEVQSRLTARLDPAELAQLMALLNKAVGE
ncbi:MarR family winged helix-turn-helix transcriptional regulator [Jiella sp. M17.18]|uniref:MarR family winged helix-turn-helix transcriptional regulator n=1 Tax=Jiella sp. M17.18 TaxID=3234247 RepID=UPI0034DEBCE6